MGIEGSDEGVEVAIVVGDLGFRGESGGPVLARRELAKRRDRRRLAPHLVVVLPVYDHRVDGSPGRDRRGGGRPSPAGPARGGAVSPGDGPDREPWDRPP